MYRNVQKSHPVLSTYVFYAGAQGQHVLYVRWLMTCTHLFKAEHQES